MHPAGAHAVSPYLRASAYHARSRSNLFINGVSTVSGTRDKTEALIGAGVDYRLAPGRLVQTEINRVEAAHKSVFVAGWRPFIGCAAWHCSIISCCAICCSGWRRWPGQKTPPALQLDVLTTMLYALLGLGGLRTFEKIKAARNNPR